MGLTLGISSAAFFGLNAVLIRIGMRRRPWDDGHFMSVLVNVAVFGAILPFLTLPQWDWEAAFIFVLAGLMTTWMARGASFKAIRLLGPARQSAVLISAPLFTGMTGWMFLGERLSLLQGFAGVLVLGGVALVIASHGRPRSGRRDTLTASPDPVIAELPSDGTQGRNVPGKSRVRGFAYALVAAVMFGVGFVVRKQGLARYPSALTGAYLGAATSLLLILTTSTFRGRLRSLAADNFRHIPFPFLAAGILTSIGLMFQFTALLYLPAWMVSVFQGTVSLWTLFWSYVFIKEEEQINVALVASTLIVVAGVVLMSIQL
jgi:drug/metabolite transporter (DMT)-like permease